ncbi:MAG TPA: Holliday junction DNA helicase RuvB C-terminal domain-containing protein [Fimbriiglobus sp.]|nr:Holliday junction DNA helicase RuvB C-terminal domain-containing protein [Fimbriiglobus sp.]
MAEQRPSNEINDVAPTSLKHMIGQKGVMAQVAVALDAAFADNKKFDSSLLVGPPGCGKSQTARIIAAEMATDLHEVLGQSVGNSADLNALLLSAKDKDVVHIDEAHELDKEFQTALYLAMDQRRVVLQARSKSGPQSIPLADFSLLLSTTDEYCLLQPLRDRMRLLLRFEFYAVEELTTLLHQRANAIRWPIHEGLLPQIARRSRGTPRLALRLLQSCRRVCRSVGETTITGGHLRRACELEGIDEIGLGPAEQQYLRALAEGASRLNVVASLLGLPARTVSQVVEPFLLRVGLIVKDDQGRRELTAKGRGHLSQSGQLRDQLGEHS